jgi:hypothetical protein
MRDSRAAHMLALRSSDDHQGIEEALTCPCCNSIPRYIEIWEVMKLSCNWGSSSAQVSLFICDGSEDLVATQRKTRQRFSQKAALHMNPFSLPNGHSHQNAPWVLTLLWVRRRRSTQRRRSDEGIVGARRGVFPIMPNNTAALVLSRSHFVPFLHIGNSARDTSRYASPGP